MISPFFVNTLLTSFHILVLLNFSYAWDFWWMRMSLNFAFYYKLPPKTTNFRTMMKVAAKSSICNNILHLNIELFWWMNLHRKSCLNWKVSAIFKILISQVFQHASNLFPYENIYADKFTFNLRFSKWINFIIIIIGVQAYYP